LQHGHPYISSMVNNGSLHYDHDLDGTHTALSGCEANVRGVSQETYLAVRYERDRLTVSICMSIYIYIYIFIYTNDVMT